MRILLVEDSPAVMAPLASGLGRSGYRVEQATDGETGLWHARSHHFDLIVLDIMLPRLDGLSLLRKLREGGSDTRVLLLTARDTVPDRVAGLRAGADDYLVKPFSFDELLARIEALLRRGPTAEPNLTAGGVVVDLQARQALVGGEPLPLAPREFAILAHLLRNRGRVVTREQIGRVIYEPDAEPQSNAVDSAVCALRRKLEQARASLVIETRRGHGYLVSGDRP